MSVPDKNKNLYAGVAVLLIVLGLAEDATVALLVFGILTSLAGVALYYFKVLRRRR